MTNLQAANLLTAALFTGRHDLDDEGKEALTLAVHALIKHPTDEGRTYCGSTITELVDTVDQHIMKERGA